MVTRKPHLWYLDVEDKARNQIRGLQSKERQAVFTAIRELLVEENPRYAYDTRKLVEKRFEGLWRKRQGDYRVFFAIETGHVVVDKFEYKGIVTIVEVLHRKDAY